MNDNDITEDSASSVQGTAAPFADRANGEPAILRGMNQSEVMLVSWVAFPVWAAFGGLLGLVTRIWALAALFGAVGPMLTVWLLAGWLATKKRNRPDGFYVHQFKAWKAKFFGKQLFITHRGYWSLGRALEVKPAPSKSKAKDKPAKATTPLASRAKHSGSPRPRVAADQASRATPSHR